MTEPFRLHIGGFSPTVLGLGDTFILELQVLPRTIWTVNAHGPGMIHPAEIEQALNAAVMGRLNISEFSQLQDTRGQFEYSCDRRAITDGTLEFTRDLVDASTLGSRTPQYLPGRIGAPPPGRIEDPEVARRFALAEKPFRDEAARQVSVDKKAWETLDRLLTEEQRSERRRYDYFHVIGSEGTKYRILTTGLVGNVRWVNDRGIEKGRYCAAPSSRGRDLGGAVGHLPLADGLLGQKLMLETNEKAFHQVANRMRGVTPPGVMRSSRTPFLVSEIPAIGRPG